jgi:hypothetical protein
VESVSFVRRLDWERVFDIRHQESGASLPMIESALDSFRQPMSSSEIADVLRKQTNPFPSTHPLHSTYYPIDPRHWRFPQGELPPLFVELIQWSNGGDISNDSVAFFPLLSCDDWRGYSIAYMVPEFMPQAFPFALNGGGSLYVFDMREPAKDGEYPIWLVDAGALSFDDAEFVAAEFIKALGSKT